MNFLITGGASGLGYAITKSIADNFPASTVYFTYYSSAESAGKLEKEYKNLKSLKCDFRQTQDIETVINLFGTEDIDILINNAITRLDKQHFHKTPVNDFLETFATDIVPTLRITQGFIQKARERKSGKIITMLSSAVLNVPPTGWSVYVANKAYLLAMHKSWATENKAFNITSNCISPDFLATPLHGEMDERVMENMIKSHPLKRLLTVGEVAEVVLFLCNASAQLNGQNIVLNSAMNL